MKRLLALMVAMIMVLGLAGFAAASGFANGDMTLKSPDFKVPIIQAPFIDSPKRTGDKGLKEFVKAATWTKSGKGVSQIAIFKAIGGQLPRASI